MVRKGKLTEQFFDDIEDGDLCAITKWIKNGAGDNAVSCWSVTQRHLDINAQNDLALCWSIKQGYVKIVTLLLKKRR